MPNDTINNAIKKASSSNENYEEITYEGYGPNGVAVIVEASTDNKNRTAADVRHVFDRAGGNLGTSGCVSYMFNKKGVLIIDKAETELSEDDIMMLALDAGAEDFEADEEIYTVTTSPEDFSKVREALEKHLGLGKGKQTTDDMMFTIEIVSCLGACGLAPVMTVNDKVHPKMTPDKAVEIIDELKEGECE